MTPTCRLVLVALSLCSACSLNAPRNPAPAAPPQRAPIVAGLAELVGRAQQCDGTDQGAAEVAALGEAIVQAIDARVHEADDPGCGCR